ncbi:MULTISPECIES: M48 family metallopeptidase [Alcaligenes]|uniref:M48 family metallopeptidase n=1 Tax=Alcaligenes TaxID=507 RepID=UPI0028825FA3|nr:SprT family zinc-dependent metalloprotease [Alcaligenes sp. AB3]MDT0216769.1 SprT family zinc-dependent metalloprotease [Alcaligenes sp. AB3]
MLKVADIDCTVLRSARRSVAIFIERDGSVSVRAPSSIADEQLVKVVEKKLPWIYRNMALWRELNRNVPKREFVSGESFYVAGKPCILDVRSDTNKPLELVGDRLVLKRSQLAKAEELLRALYRKLGYERLPGIIDRYASRMGVRPGKLRVWELQNRWASCSELGNLNFHWKVMSLPGDVLEYLVVHELAHIKHRNHTKEFWGEVDKALPGWKHAAAWLRDNGAGRTF